MTLVLPTFELLKRQPDPPHNARTLVQRKIRNEHGAAIVFTVRVNRAGNRWWISASFQGIRMSNTLTTSSLHVGRKWIDAVKSCGVKVSVDLSFLKTVGHFTPTCRPITKTVKE